jgi:hypothetical protein
MANKFYINEDFRSYLGTCEPVSVLVILYDALLAILKTARKVFSGSFFNIWHFH